MMRLKELLPYLVVSRQDLILLAQQVGVILSEADVENKGRLFRTKILKRDYAVSFALNRWKLLKEYLPEEIEAVV